METRLRSGTKRETATPSQVNAGVKTRSQKRARGEVLASSFPDVLPDQRRRRKASPERSPAPSRPQRRGRSSTTVGQDKAQPSALPAAQSDRDTYNQGADVQELGSCEGADPKAHMDKASRQARARQTKAEAKGDDIGSAEDEQQVGSRLTTDLSTPSSNFVLIRVLFATVFPDIGSETVACIQPVATIPMLRSQDKFNAEQALFGRHSR